MLEYDFIVRQKYDTFESPTAVKCFLKVVFFEKQRVVRTLEPDNLLHTQEVVGFDSLNSTKTIVIQVDIGYNRTR